MLEESHEQFPVPTPSALLPAEVLQGTARSLPPPIVRIGRWLRFRRFLRLLLRRILYNLVQLWRKLRPFLAVLVVILLLLGLIGWMSYQLWWPSTSIAPLDTRVASMPRPESIERYIQGRTAYDAEQTWAAYSPEYQSEQLAAGITKEVLQVQLNRERMARLRYVEYEYVGGVPMEKDGSMYFYTILMQIGDKRVKLPVIFLVDANGKITNISVGDLD